MAVYFNLTIDCGVSGEAADQIASAFETFSIPIADAPVLCCEVYRHQQKGHEIVYVWPIGWGYNTYPTFRPELMDFETTAMIGEALLDLLRTLTGYRMALLGRETQEAVEFGAIITDQDLNWPGCIFAETLLSESSLLWDRPVFSPGYRWIPDTKEEFRSFFEARYGTSFGSAAFVRPQPGSRTQI